MQLLRKSFKLNCFFQRTDDDSEDEVSSQSTVSRRRAPSTISGVEAHTEEIEEMETTVAESAQVETMEVDNTPGHITNERYE